MAHGVLRTATAGRGAWGVGGGVWWGVGRGAWSIGLGAWIIPSAKKVDIDSLRVDGFHISFRHGSRKPESRDEREREAGIYIRIPFLFLL
jgi:hypothetical protein